MNIKNIFFFVLTITTLASCEEVIELDLENAAPKLVIEAALDANNQDIGVFLTKSNGFYDDISLDVIEDANIILTLADSSTIDVPHFSNGLYLAGNLNVQTDDELSILVTYEGTEYRATTKVPHAIAMDSLQIVESERGGRGSGGPFGGGNDEKFYQIFTHWQDVADVESFYRIRATLNDTLQTGDYNLTDDLGLPDDGIIARPFFQPFQEGDTVSIQLMSIDKGSYQYFNDLSAVQGQGFNSTTPFNPKSNFDNGALGYFGIFRSDTKTVILP